MEKPVSKKYSKNSNYEEEGPTDDVDDMDDTAPPSSIFDEHHHHHQPHNHHHHHHHHLPSPLLTTDPAEMAALKQSSTAPLEPIVSLPLTMSAPETLNLVPPPQLKQPSKKGKPHVIHH